MARKLTVLVALAAAVAVVASAVPAGAAAPAGTKALREFEGTVVSKNRTTRSFRLRDEGRTVRIVVTRNTRYERVNGFAGIHVGARNIEATTRKRDGRWIAVEVERSGRDDDNRAGDDDRGGDDRRDGNDDRGGDDHGGGGRDDG
jgi:uncharacterized membrane protein YgcG